MRRNRIIYYILCILALVLASFYGGPVSYSLLLGLLLITPVSFIYLLVVFFFFRIYQVVESKHISACEPVGYYFILQNEYLLNFCHIRITMYSTFSYIEKMPENSEYELLPYESARYDTRLVCRYRGEYKVGIKKITITDYLKLFSVTYHVPEPISAVVSPRIVKLASISTLSDTIRSSFRERPGMKQDYDAAVREYIPGDPLKAVHQKLTAKTGRLMSRLMIGEEKQGIAIFLDTDRISEDEFVYIPVENKCLEIVLALADHYAASSIASVVKYYRFGKSGRAGDHEQNSSLGKIRCAGINDMERVLTQVSSVMFRNDGSSSQAVRMISEDPLFLNSLMVYMVVTGACRELNETLSELSVYGVPCVIYYVSYEPDTGSIISLPGQRVIPVHPEDDLQEVM